MMKATVGGNIFNERVIQMRAICCLMPSWRSLKFVSVSFNCVWTYFALIGDFGTRSTKKCVEFIWSGRSWFSYSLSIFLRKDNWWGETTSGRCRGGQEDQEGKEDQPIGGFHFIRVRCQPANAFHRRKGKNREREESKGVGGLVVGQGVVLRQ